MSSESGQATVAAMILLPLILVVAGGLAVILYAMKLEANVTAACRMALNKSQTEAAAALHELRALNTAAKNSEHAVKAANAAYVAAVAAGPAALAAATATRRTAIAAQAAIAAKQKYWLAKGRLASNLAAWKANLAVQAELKKASSLIAIQFPQTQRAQFRVRSFPPTAKTPRYQPEPGFSRSQEARLKLQSTLRLAEQSQTSGWSDGAAQLALDLLGTMSFGCAMTLTQTKGDRWLPAATEDKLLSN